MNIEHPNNLTKIEHTTASAVQGIQTMHLGEIPLEKMTLVELEALHGQLLLALTKNMGDPDKQDFDFDLEANRLQLTDIEAVITKKKDRERKYNVH